MWNYPKKSKWETDRMKKGGREQEDLEKEEKGQAKRRKKDYL